jgi:hypothetical protein
MMDYILLIIVLFIGLIFGFLMGFFSGVATQRATMLEKKDEVIKQYFLKLAKGLNSGECYHVTLGRTEIEEYDESEGWKL